MTTSTDPGQGALWAGNVRRVALLLVPLVGAAVILYQKVHAQGRDCKQPDGSAASCTNDEAIPGVAEAGFVKIHLTRCDDGAVARWHPGSEGFVTFKINDWVGVNAEVVRAVREGALLWNRAQPFYAIKEVSSHNADIVIEVFDQVFPGIVGATKVKCANGREGIRAAVVYLGVKGIRPLGVRNMAAHEIGHALGLGHSNKSHDLMDARLAEEEVDTRAICPSNLDRGGLIAGFRSYAIPKKNWVEMECPTWIRG